MKTPAYIFDEVKFTERLKQFSDLRQSTRFKLLYSIKALPLACVLEKMLPYVDGFSASSLFEAKLAREVIKEQGSIHITTPGFRPDEIDELLKVSDYININSLSQWQRFSDHFGDQTSIGMRINPQLSFLHDDRFDPCRTFSKLGIGIDQLQNQNEVIEGMSGLHFHTMFGSESVKPLEKTIKKIESKLGDFLHKLKWINLGGGYVFNDQVSFSLFEKIVHELINKYDLTVFFEPGKGIVGDAAELITEVIDLFESDGKMIAVLDTSVCHHPEIFEYQISAQIKESSPGTKHAYLLAGASCKSGDLFGEHHFSEPLAIGSKLTMQDVGAYTLVKASRFNGINLPDIYLKDEKDQLQLIKQYDYKDYQQYFSV
ncbi:MAG: carboxynorspermidine decarboxylase [Gammaproteobacteria bacterium]